MFSEKIDIIKNYNSKNTNSLRYIINFNEGCGKKIEILFQMKWDY
jgi:hypothetical protein